MLYITRKGDTWMSIAKNHFGLNCRENDFLSLINANRDRYVQVRSPRDLLNCSHYKPYYSLEPYRAIWLPESYSPLPGYSRTYLESLNYMLYDQRKKISDIQESGIGVQHAVAAVEVMQLLKKKLDSHKEDVENTSSTIDNINTFIGTAIDARIEEVEKSIKNLNKVLTIYSHTPIEKFRAIRENELYDAWYDAMDNLNNEFHFSAIKKVPELMDGNNPFQHLNGFYIRSASALEALNHAEKYLHIADRFSFWLDLFLDAFDVGTVFAEGGDWEKEATGVITAATVGAYTAKLFNNWTKKYIEEYASRFIINDEVLIVLSYLPGSIAPAVTKTVVNTAPRWIPIVVTAAVLIEFGSLFESIGKKAFSEAREQF